MRVGLTVNAKLDKMQYPINLGGDGRRRGFREPRIACIVWGMDLCHQADPVYLPAVDSPGRARLVVPADPLMPDWLTPLNQLVSLPATSQH